MTDPEIALLRAENERLKRALEVQERETRLARELAHTVCTPDDVAAEEVHARSALLRATGGEQLGFGLVGVLVELLVHERACAYAAGYEEGCHSSTTP